MARVPFPDWSRLIGIPVQIRQYGTAIRSGVVDDAMPDSSMLWLMADSSQGRTLYSAYEGHEAWIEPELLEAHHLLQVAAPVTA
ncbi:hypothetical protein GA0061083_2287 [Pseudarthrobacter enclensis]|uniref:Uncharacterized protein n=2 Tax=Pseudarthrobacter enclensis TaxID=993070 RepID=A0A0V8IPY6_9MICC|nr:hypothetical protein [Pseudarthrobacter enclensis]KSU76872.1 hypothetical protein AS031_09795 [Pseudarthrobacter enclensis]SCC04193.1 hypothetical protein GA0061083_2287 [Pseudarthrobacter enclensis]